MIDAPCRLSVFLARDVPKACLLRRGPSDWAQLIAWDRRDDSFTPGQWLHGRVYGRRSDLSPDGRLFVYFAAKEGGKDLYKRQVGDAWTAVSKPPYFTALALWGSLGRWYGGGVFLAADELRIDPSCSLEPHPEFKPKGLKVAPVGAETAPWEQRLLRDGWRLKSRGFAPRTHARLGDEEIWTKPQPAGTAVLFRELEDYDPARTGGPYGETFWLEAEGELLPLPEVTWADWDGGRLLFVRAGKLYRATLAGLDLAEEELYDPNPLVPEEVSAPGWARQW